MVWIFFKGKFRENSSIRKTVAIRWWWIRGGEKGAEGTDMPAVSVERGRSCQRPVGAFPHPRAGRRDGDVTFSCFLHGCSCWGRGVSVGRGRLREVICHRVSPAELGKPLHLLPDEKSCFGLNPCVAAAEGLCSHVWRANPSGAQGSRVLQGAAQCVRVSWDYSERLGNKRQCSSGMWLLCPGELPGLGALSKSTIEFVNAVVLSQCS